MANVLTATRRTQGKRGNDFCHVPEGELVTFGSECDGEGPDGPCGCKRSLVGIECLTATTTFEVAHVPQLGPKTLAGYILQHYIDGGWGKMIPEDELAKMADDDATELLRIAAAFPVGAVVEKRGDVFRQRGTR